MKHTLAEKRDQLQKEIDKEKDRIQDELEFKEVKRQYYLEKTEKEILVELLLSMKDQNDALISKIKKLEGNQKTLIKEVQSIQNTLDLM